VQSSPTNYDCAENQTDQYGRAPEKPLDLRELHIKLARMSESELIAYGQQLRRLIFPRMVSGIKGKSSRSNWEIEYEQARAEWRRRHPKASPDR
jgi:hypothetical protein